MYKTDQLHLIKTKQYYATKEEDYKKKMKSSKIILATTAQYVKFVNAHLAAKQSKLDKLKTKKNNLKKKLLH